MSHSFTQEVIFNGEASNAKQAGVYTNSLVTVPAGGIGLYIVDPAAIYRQVEIVNAWRMMYAGIRDRFLWPEDNFGPGSIYSGVPVDSATEAERLTSLDANLVFLPGVIAIGISPEIRNSILSGAPDATNIHELFFDRLIDFAREHALFKADGAHWNPEIPATATALDLVSPGLAPTGNTGLLTLDANRGDAINMQQADINLVDATIEEAHLAVFNSNTINQWEPYYLKYWEPGQSYLYPHAEAGSHVDFNATWTPA